MAPEYRGRIGIDIAYSNPDVVYAYIDDYEVVREPTEEEKNDSYGLPSCGFIRGAQLFRSDNKGESWEGSVPWIILYFKGYATLMDGFLVRLLLIQLMKTPFICRVYRLVLQKTAEKHGSVSEMQVEIIMVSGLIRMIISS